MSDESYLIGMGDLYVGVRDQTTGLPGVLRNVGEVAEFEVNIEVQRATHDNTSGPIAVEDLDVVVKQSAGIKMILHAATAKNLALAYFGEVVVEADGPFADLALPDDLVVGDVVQVPGGRAMLSTVTLEDSTPVTPLPLTLGTHYTIDLKTGLITIVSLGVLIQPFLVSGTEGTGKTSVALLNTRSQELYLFLAGTNLGDDDKPFIFEGYRASFSPAAVVKLKSMEVTPFELAGKLLADKTKGIDPTFGYYGRHRMLE